MMIYLDEIGGTMTKRSFYLSHNTEKTFQAAAAVPFFISNDRPTDRLTTLFELDFATASSGSRGVEEEDFEMIREIQFFLYYIHRIIIIVVVYHC